EKDCQCQRKIETSASPQSRKFRFCCGMGVRARGKGWFESLAPRTSIRKPSRCLRRIFHGLPNRPVAQLCVSFRQATAAIEQTLLGPALSLARTSLVLLGAGEAGPALQADARMLPGPRLAFSSAAIGFRPTVSPAVRELRACPAAMCSRFTRWITPSNALSN